MSDILKDLKTLQKKFDPIYQAAVGSTAFRSQIMKLAQAEEVKYDSPFGAVLGTQPLYGLEILTCDEMPTDEILMFKKKKDAHYFVLAVKELGYKKAKEIYGGNDVL